jgi:hypothetical protein
VILHHIPERAGTLIERPSAFDADRFGDSELHMINIAPVPDRLENCISETEHQKVLRSLFTEIMINSVNLMFLQDRC